MILIKKRKDRAVLIATSAASSMVFIDTTAVKLSAAAVETIAAQASNTSGFLPAAVAALMLRQISITKTA